MRAQGRHIINETIIVDTNEVTGFSLDISCQFLLIALELHSLKVFDIKITV